MRLGGGVSLLAPINACNNLRWYCPVSPTYHILGRYVPFYDDLRLSKFDLSTVAPTTS